MRLSQRYCCLPPIFIWRPGSFSQRGHRLVGCAAGSPPEFWFAELVSIAWTSSKLTRAHELVAALGVRRAIDRRRGQGAGATINVGAPAMKFIPRWSSGTRVMSLVEVEMRISS